VNRRLPRRADAVARSCTANALAVTALAITLSLAAGCASGPAKRVTPYDAALRQVQVRGDHLAWGDLETGMTFHQVERTLGRRLPPVDGPDELCGDYYAITENLGQRLSLTFSGPTEQARLRSIGVLLAPGFDLEAVVDGLRARLPRMEWVPSRHDRDAAEHELRNRLYQVGEAGVVFVNPDGGFTLGDVCID
jgi:hypothetical protein